MLLLLLLESNDQDEEEQCSSSCLSVLVVSHDHDFSLILLSFILSFIPFIATNEIFGPSFDSVRLLWLILSFVHFSLGHLPSSSWLSSLALFFSSSSVSDSIMLQFEFLSCPIFAYHRHLDHVQFSFSLLIPSLSLFLFISCPKYSLFYLLFHQWWWWCYYRW